MALLLVLGRHFYLRCLAQCLFVPGTVSCFCGESLVLNLFVCGSLQISQVLLTFPYSFAQLGLVSGILYQLLYAAMGCWSCYMTTSLYIIYKERRAKQKNPMDCHEYRSIQAMLLLILFLDSLQWYEVMDGLLGWRWKIAGLVFNTGDQFLTCVIFLVGCSSLTHSLNHHLNKRTWTLVLTGCFLTMVLIPRAQHYRIWSSIGIVATTYTAWYLTIASILLGPEPDVKHTAPPSTVQYFVGATNMLYAFGGHAITIEIADAMREPKNFKVVYFYCILYILTLTLPSAIAMYWAFGDTMLHNTYALAVLPRSKFHVAANVLMLFHQFMQFGFMALPIFMKWEKLLGIHRSKNYWLKAVSRIPVVLLVWFFAIMTPFTGLIDSIVGSIFTSFSVYIIPCLAHMVLHKTFTARKDAIEQPPFFMPSWVGIYCLNLAVVLWVLIAGVGLGGWSAISTLLENIRSFGPFPKCFQCQAK
ncbi:hypothetical protein SELMODRAFT_85340 [Selaginella moellendorffii]|uniref:Amino acid transporter transmembrane domain-containing protein n=1 Tax=Selaginella moellendorffii TaxID=88036 RepID=D8R533_SELML|nr:hypothetical protein SELMODRAFT_85340 [Selaginella moellendorffii]